MPDFEITGDIHDMTKALDGLKFDDFESTKGDASDIEKINDEFNDKYAKIGEHSGFQFDKDGNLETSKGEPVDPTKINEKMLNGDFKGALEDLGFEVDGEQEVSIKSEEELYKKTEGYKQREALSESEKIGKDLVDKEGVQPEPNPNDLTAKDKEALEKIKQTKIDQLEEEKTAMKEGKEVEKKSWAEKAKETIKDKGKQIAKLIAAGFAIGELAKMIKEHQNAMNGCWVVNTSTGAKCKPNFLQCGDNANKTSHMCLDAAYHDDSAKGGVGSWDCSNINTQMGPGLCKCGKSKTQFCLDHKRCLPVPITTKKTKESFTYSMATDPKSKSCIKVSQACDNGEIKKSCPAGCGTGALPPLPKGFHYRCVNVSFWSAAADWTKNAAHDIIKGAGGIISDAIKTIFKQFWPIILGVVIVIIVLGIAWWIFNKMKNNNIQAQIKELELEKMKATAFNFFNKRNI